MMHHKDITTRQAMIPNSQLAPLSCCELPKKNTANAGAVGYNSNGIIFNVECYILLEMVVVVG